MIEVEKLCKTYGSVDAVKDLSFSVQKGEVVGFLGPNGAGKSTTLRILAGFLGASSGTVRVAGHDIASEPLQARMRLGYMPETSPLYPEMRVREYLRFRAELKRVPRKDRRSAVLKAMADANLEEMADAPIGHLSKGYRQRVGLADALVASPPLLILDEPTAGLDPNQIREVRLLIKRLSERHTILLSTHILSEVEASCGRAVVIARGRLVAEGTLAEIRAQRQGRAVAVVARGSDTDGRAALRAVKGLRRVSVSDVATGSDTAPLSQFRLEFHRNVDAARVVENAVRALVTAGLGVRQVGSLDASLEAAFTELTSEADRTDEPFRSED